MNACVEYTPVRVKMGTSSVNGWFPSQYSDLLTRNWIGVEAEVEPIVEEEPSELPESLAELKLVSGTGHYVAVWIRDEIAQKLAKFLVNTFDCEVIYYLFGKEMSRYDRADGRIRVTQRHSI